MARLNINIIDESKQPGYKMCGHHCAVHRFCVAINYKENDNGSEPNCQLTNITNHTFNEKARKKDKIGTFRKVKADRSLLVSSRDLSNLTRAPKHHLAVQNFKSKET